MSRSSEMVRIHVHTTDEYFTRTVEREEAKEYLARIRSSGLRTYALLTLPEEKRANGSLAHEAHIVVNQITHILIERLEDTDD